MSRELKFRAWDKKNGYYADYEDIEEEITAQAIDGWRSGDGGTSFNLDYGIKDFVVEQYTGLKDKNGKEIYEGDIVRYADDYEENAEVVFDDGGFQVEWPINIERLEGDITCMMEVIGNIHENKELLGDEE